MNAVEIEQAISDLALLPFDAAEFPFAFLAAFGNKDTALKRLRAGNNNASDLPGGVLQRNNIHIAVCPPGTTGAGLQALRSSPATIKGKAKFILATDGQTLEAEDLTAGETIACDYADFPDHFGFFLPLAGISTVKEIKDNPIDVRATGRLNKLYVELLRENPGWATAERRGAMNHFMARLIFCFFAEDTDIFNGDALFTRTLEQMSDRDAGNTHQVLSEIFRAMNVKIADRSAAKLRPWADQFPSVNGGLFSGSAEVPRFTRMARTDLLQVEVEKASSPMCQQAEMTFGNTPIDGGHLLKDARELEALGLSADQAVRFTRRIYGSSEFIRGLPRHCLWISDEDLAEATSIPAVRKRVELVRESRQKSGATAKEIAFRAHQFQRMNEGRIQTIVVPGVSSENRPFLPVGLIERGAGPSNKCFALYDAPLWNMALIAFADLYDPDTMPENLRQAHEHNDEVLERIYIGRRFKNDTERLEKLFDLYTKMVAKASSAKQATAAPAKRAVRKAAA